MLNSLFKFSLKSLSSQAHTNLHVVILCFVDTGNGPVYLCRYEGEHWQRSGLVGVPHFLPECKTPEFVLKWACFRSMYVFGNFFILN